MNMKTKENSIVLNMSRDVQYQNLLGLNVLTIRI